MKIALVHDWLNQFGGAEQVLSALHQIFPEAPIYTSIYWPQAMPSEWCTWDIRPTWLDRLPLIHRRHQPYLPLYPLAFGGVDLSDYDVVISNKSAFCHGVRTGPRALHICYCLTPTRFLWQYETYIQEERVGPLARVFLPAAIELLKRWDFAAAQRVEHFIAISQMVRQRIARFYRRDSTVIHPPVEVERFRLAADPDDYFIVVSRLVPYKRIDLAVHAFSELKLPLLVIGDGRDRPRLESLAGPSVRFLGRLPNGQVAHYLSRARALVFPGEEDFGIAPLEAQACGRPVIAYAGGGALETVQEGVSGVLFNEPSIAALVATIQSFDHRHFDPAAIREHARRFDVHTFQEKLRTFIEQHWAEVSAPVGVP